MSLYASTNDESLSLGELVEKSLHVKFGPAVCAPVHAAKVTAAAATDRTAKDLRYMASMPPET
jgi:hypothetical protein